LYSIINNKHNTIMKKTFFSPSETARAWGVTIKYVYDLLAAGKLKAQKRWPGAFQRPL